MLDLCEQIFARYGVRNLRYDGKMSREAREYCLSQFRRPGGPKVMLVSIKCGGVGLNLVSANRVIKCVHLRKSPVSAIHSPFGSMDLSWNYAAESQAYDRVHRLGQEKSVVVKRLVVRDTIEQRYAFPSLSRHVAQILTFSSACSRFKTPSLAWRKLRSARATALVCRSSASSRSRMYVSLVLPFR